MGDTNSKIGRTDNVESGFLLFQYAFKEHRTLLERIYTIVCAHHTYLHNMFNTNRGILGSFGVEHIRAPINN